jgi:hypothetical protein
VVSPGSILPEVSTFRWYLSRKSMRLSLIYNLSWAYVFQYSLGK